ncbi:MAG: hypothetical protein OEV40_15370 [Acidimicrobiia bacterium]|nr:hypothetical protein [Acidimicrobiia bacterium]
MRKTFAALAMVASMTAGLAVTADAATAAPNERGACVQAGLGTLKDLGLLQAAAQGQIDYSTLADPVNGPIFADLPEGSFLKLGQVVKLHTTNPELFAWC